MKKAKKKKLREFTVRMTERGHNCGTAVVEKIVGFQPQSPIVGELATIKGIFAMVGNGNRIIINPHLEDEYNDPKGK